MATTYKSLSTNDIVTTKTLLHEAIPITGTIVSGTYLDGSNEISIKNYTHGMFQSVYDYPYLSSSANHIFDLSVGFHADSSLSGTSNSHVQVAKKINMYNQMAQVLMGYDENGNIRKFDEDGDLTGGTKMEEVIFINFARLLTKDEIKKGSFNLEIGTEEVFGTPFSERIKLVDTNAQNDYRVNSPAGDYAILYADSTAGTNLTTDDGTQKAGLIFYQAGIAVVSASVFLEQSEGGILLNTKNSSNMSGSSHIDDMLSGSAISASCDAIRHRIYNVQFNNTTELNSTVYFCRAHHNEFNYSTNPTYLSSSKLVVKNNASDTPVSYITTVGLYSADNELLAVAKLSEPLKKDPSNELTLRVRLDY
jgi:hypothetical protein